MTAESWGAPDEAAAAAPASEPEPATDATPAAAAPPVPVVDGELEPEVEPEAEATPPPRRGAAGRPQANEPDIPLRPRQPDAAPPKGNKPSGGVDIDLTDVLAELQGINNPPKGKPAPPPAASLEDAFKDFRSEVSKQTGTHAAREQLTLAKTYLEMGMTDEAIASLTEASRNPAFRFEAASLLGRLYQKRDDLPHAAEWLERAAEAPAPSANEGRELLYDLGAILETLGETARALAVLMELQADAGEYRDVAARVERLARVQTGG
jgi:hypothetical protein